MSATSQQVRTVNNIAIRAYLTSIIGYICIAKKHTESSRTQGPCEVH